MDKRRREMIELPVEVLADILSRLPVKSLMCLKSVCRSWRSLVGDPHFVAEYLARSGSNRFLLANYYSDLHGQYLISLLSCETLEVIGRVEIPHPIRSGYFRVVGSINGIVCLVSDLPGYRVSLLNPATRESRLLADPSIPLEVPRTSVYRGVYYGFGYHRGIDDYKLVRIIATIDSGSKLHYGYRAKVFSLKDGLWKEIPAPNCDIVYKLDGTVAEGVVHWIACGGRHEGSEVVLSFDLGNDKFERQCLPDLGEDDGDCKRLTVFEESLRLVVYSRLRGDRCLVIWVRNSRASQDVWTRLARIEPTFGTHRPVGWGARGEFLMENNYGKLVVYEVNNQNIQNKRVDAEKIPCYFDFHPYVESVVPLTR
ncbi:F-box/kelch-repeat protein At3g06240-like [Punica granatum]|uniref:F-box domain-containing protein n=2 Tax=Punica granatum TaxID=22663 RepID=A0A218WKG7_PUNGR|nr:F-box/kelch-repeat protein At3g06240-like [Punica granatum]XP_031394054.1 F-box/kelch-repeat protein At3g06240-like [Punica granatum]XP_031394055.1 F-box/kelch-repeat protein At3g06240-like [Punica granatum]OWM73327.1 hypothetical protein CDL15_Pgr001441 [Punica granatum]PKI62867.1 hypothetical protein CRG98_016704 [Punica granatum]